MNAHSNTYDHIENPTLAPIGLNEIGRKRREHRERLFDQPESTIDLDYRDFSGLNLELVNLRQGNFHGSLFTGTRLAGADLMGASFKEADLQGCDLEGVFTRGVNFEYATFNPDVGRTFYISPDTCGRHRAVWLLKIDEAGCITHGRHGQWYIFANFGETTHESRSVTICKNFADVMAKSSKPGEKLAPYLLEILAHKKGDGPHDLPEM